MSHPTSSRRRRVKWLHWMLSTVVTLIVAMVAAALFLPGFVDRSTVAHEVVAASVLRRIQDHQMKFASAHPAAGFACRLGELIPAGSETSDEYRFLKGQRFAGYMFHVAGCDCGNGKPAQHYQIVAVPGEPGQSGVRAFCMDENGVVWSDAEGSAAKCLANRKPLE